MRRMGMIALAIALAVIAACTHSSLELGQGDPGSPTPTGSGSTPTGTNTPGPSPTGSVLWKSDFETGTISEWSGDGQGGIGFATGSAGLAVVSGTAHTGSYSARFRVNPSGGSEAGLMLDRANELFFTGASSTLYYRAWFFIPVSTVASANSNPYWDIASWFGSTGGPSGTDLFDIDIEQNGNQITLDGYADLDKKDFPSNLAVPFGAWTRLDVAYDCSISGTGTVTAWQDGTQIFAASGIQTSQTGLPCGFQLGSDTNGVNPSPALIYFDDVSIATGMLPP